MLTIIDSRKPPIELAIEYFHNHWIEGKTLKEVSVRFRVDQGNLSREFRRRYGLSPKEYLDWRRMEYLCVRLRDNPRLGYEIGNELGFLSEVSFYKWVRRVFGVPLSRLQRDLEVFGKGADKTKNRHKQKTVKSLGKLGAR